MKKTLTLIAAGLLALTASCTYNTNGSHNSKGACVPIVQPAPVVVQPVVRPVYVEPVVETVQLSVRTYSYRPAVIPPRCYSYLYIE
jgi:hypothetical protein